MKSKILVLILLIIATQSLLGQNKRQRKAAETFYKSQKLINNYTNSWYWLFGPSNSQENNDKYNLKKVKLSIGKETENAVEVLNPEMLMNKQILIKNIGMLLNDSEGGHSH